MLIDENQHDDEIVSKFKCEGCGVGLQHKDKETIGYIDKVWFIIRSNNSYPNFNIAKTIKLIKT